MVCGLWLLVAARVFGGNFYAGTSPANVPWPGGIVPYEFTNTLTLAQQQTYLDGLREWELAANVKFVPHTNQTHWILFAYNTNFLDFVSGGSYNPQLVTVSSLSRAQVCHEMGHSFGFTHENIRPDATNYVTVLTNNITNEPANIYWFTIDPASVTNGNYDFESVMHLGWDFDSTNFGVLATQQPRPPYFPRYQFRMGNFCLSPGDRAALAYLYGPPAVPLTNVVTTTADVGPGSLRAAIYYATDHPGSVVKFNISTNDPGYSNGVFNLHLTGQLPPLVANGMVLDGSTQPGFAGQPLIVVDGSQILPETFTSDTGVLIYSSSNQLKNIAFTGFNWNGLTLEYADATNNTIAGCWLGVDATGSNAAPNAFQGILIASGASGNTIGGTNALARNVLSGNSQYGIFITDSNTTGNVVLGNFIGTAASGSDAVPNESSGVFVGNAAGGNTIGSANPAGRNIISGNAGYGIWISNSVNNVICGNYIGVNANGETALGNQLSGIGLFGGTGNIIGGTVAGARNVISGNTNGSYYDYGMFIANPVTSGNVIEGNYIGLGADGLTPVPNYYGVLFAGGAANNLLGGTAAGAGNYVSGNSSYDVIISDPGTSGNLVEGNFIGTDATGTNGIADSIKVELQNGATGNFIGGVAPGAGNVIAGAGFLGVALYDTSTTNNSIRGNSIFDNYMGIHLFGSYYYPYVTTNHVGFLDGPNNLQNFPVITNAFGYGSGTVVWGTLNSSANGSFLIDFYRNFQPDNNIGGYGEGQFYLGAIGVTTDGSGNAVFAYTNNTGNYAGQYITATATDSSGNTSEFDLAVLATNLPAPFAQFTGPYESRTNGFAFSLTLQTNFSYRIQTTTNLAAPIAWTDLTNFTATNSPFSFTDHLAASYRVRFYRVVSP
ncbi:MAG TPA: M12 family metallopeptidase [Candidatus Limnocylindrales bacterium]|nr:M12 family metallopeptidase [Candidatus Limnocylindrales bacterium]